MNSSTSGADTTAAHALTEAEGHGRIDDAGHESGHRGAPQHRMEPRLEGFGLDPIQPGENGNTMTSGTRPSAIPSSAASVCTTSRPTSDRIVAIPATATGQLSQPPSFGR